MSEVKGSFFDGGCGCGGGLFGGSWIWIIIILVILFCCCNGGGFLGNLFGGCCDNC